ncbi:hypothetical protein M0802_012620 [Mischocyttarus mexicanus]|nr:hypothetical protein M0802_012620 [Mischocyttarus mexicanus]
MLHMRKIGHFAKYCIQSDKSNQTRNDQNDAVIHSPSSWCLDSGVTRHIINEENEFVNLSTDDTPIYTATEDCTKSSGSGVVKFETFGLKNEVIQIQLSNTFFVPGMKRNFLSVSTTVRHGYKVKFNKQGAIVRRQDGKIIMNATLKDVVCT